MEKTVLVTGANGQLGIEIRNAVGSRAASCRYIFSDVSELPGYDTVHLDITDETAVMEFCRRKSVNAIVNCAAYTDVERAEGNPEVADMLNHLAVASLAEAAREQDALMIQISTDYVFSGESCVPYRETDAPGPVSVYGITKLAGERAVINSGCRHIILRTAWLYSPYGKNFVKTMRRLTSEKDNIKVVSDQTGTPTYAADLADLIVRILEDGMTDRQGIYHFTDEGVCSWYDFAVEICSQSGNTCVIEPCRSEEFPSKVTRPHYSVLDKKLVKDTFGIRIPHWKESLTKCIGRLDDPTSL